MSLRHLVGDVGPGVRGPDDEHGPVVELVCAAVLARVQLQDRRVQFRREVRDLGSASKGAGRHDDVVALDQVVVGREDVIERTGFEAAHPRVQLDRQPPARRVGLQKVGDLCLAGVRPGLVRKPHARQAVVLGRRKERQAVPLLTPVVTDAAVAVEDEERSPQPLQVVAGRQTRLAGAADDRFHAPPHDCVRCSQDPIAAQRYGGRARSRVGRNAHLGCRRRGHFCPPTGVVRDGRCRRRRARVGICATRRGTARSPSKPAGYPGLRQSTRTGAVRPSSMLRAALRTFAGAVSPIRMCRPSGGRSPF